MDISGIDCLGLDRVLRRGSGEIIAELDKAMLVRDRISGAFFLACEDAEIGIPLLDDALTQDWDLLMVSDCSLGNAAFERFGFSEKMECFQVAYYGENLSQKTSDIIERHMWPSVHSKAPNSLEAVIVSVADKYAAVKDFVQGSKLKHDGKDE